MLLYGLIVLAGAIATPMIQNYYQQKENEKTRKEAIELAGIQRSDKLKQQKIDNNLSLRKMKSATEQNDFNIKMGKEALKDQNQEASYLYNKTNKSFIQNAANKIGGNLDDYSSMRSQIRNRGY